MPGVWGIRHGGGGGGEWSDIELTDALGSYIRKSLRFFSVMHPLVPVVKILKKNWVTGKFGESGDVSFKGSDPEKYQF